ncbi:MAG: hypothetical protein KDD82_10575 [Planctomycetes bacterium]|nr:hypothetical protein [Planctomycetota bacterium]
MTVRSLALLFVVSLGLARAEGAKEAQALFEAMEAKLSSAKTLKVDFTSRMGPAGQQLEFKGQLCVAEGNKVKFGVEGAGPDGMPLSLSMTSNGTTTRTTSEESGRSSSQDNETDPNLTKLLRGAVSHFSVVGPVFLRAAEPGSEAFSSENFSLGEKERDGERSLQVIEFDTSAMGQGFHVKLWIDTVTGLPAKRVLDRGNQPAAITETFTGLELDAEFPEDTFKVTRQADEGEGEGEGQAPTSRPVPAK